MSRPVSHALARRAILSFCLLGGLALVRSVLLWDTIAREVAPQAPTVARTLRVEVLVTAAVMAVAFIGLWLWSVRPALRAVARALREARLTNAQLSVQAEELEQQNEMLFRQQEQLLRQAEELEAQNATLFTQHDELERQAEALRDAQELTTAVVADAHDAILAFDHAGRYIVWNPAAERLYGASAASVIGSTPLDRFGTLATQEILTAHAAALRGETIAQRGRRLVDGAGEPRFVDATYSPLRARDGRVIGGVGVLHDVTEVRRAAMEVERLSTVVRQTDDAIAITDAEARLEWVNAAWERMTGWTLAEVRGRNPGEFLRGPDTDPAARDAMRRAVREGASFQGEVLNYRKGGEAYWLALTITPLRDADGTLTSFVAIERDVTERRAVERERERLATALAIAPDGVSVTDAQGRLEYCNEALARIHGVDAPGELLGHPWTSLYTADEARRLVATVESVIATTGRWQGDAIGLRGDGTTFPLELTTAALPSGGAVALVRDVTERKAQEELLRTWSLRDELTGLYNRRGFLGVARERLAAARDAGQPSVLLYLDLDDFKQINDTRGHEAGDAALVEMAAALRSAFRSADVLGRLGGDEFVVLATPCATAEAYNMRERLDRTLARRHAHAVQAAGGATVVRLVSSVGVAVDDGAPADGSAPRDLDALLRAADEALYAEKRRRKAARAADDRVDGRLDGATADVTCTGDERVAA